MKFCKNTSLFLLIAAVLCTSIADAGSPNPCHKNKESFGRKVTCQKVVVPGWMCGACTLKEPQNNGDFKNCRSIYDIKAPACQEQLKYYAWLNRDCDPVRKKQVADFSNEENVRGLDYFVYSMCEQCCDCVPRGSNLFQYKNRQKEGTLMLVNRGNCPAHAWFDVCKVLPQIRYVERPNGQFAPIMKNGQLPPKLCPALTTWIKRPQNKNWLYKSYLTVELPINNFFQSFFNVLNCRSRVVWNSCVDLEGKQKRL